MRRSHLLAEQGPYGQSSQMSSQVLEEENDNMEHELSHKIGALKSLSIDIGHEVREHNKFLTQMDLDYDSSGGFLKSTMGRVQKMAKAGHNRYICYILAFAFFVFFICWVVIKFS